MTPTRFHRLLTLGSVASTPLSAQIHDRSRDAVVRQVVPDPTALLEGEPPITTSLPDAPHRRAGQHVDPRLIQSGRFQQQG